MSPEQRQAARERCESPVGWAGWRTDIPAALDALDEADRRIQIGKDNCAALLGFMGQKDDLLEKAESRIAELEADLSQAVRVGLDWMDTAKELEADKTRLDFIIDQSNHAEHCWLDESVWDDLPGDSDDVLLEVRAAIDRAMKPEGR